MQARPIRIGSSTGACFLRSLERAGTRDFEFVPLGPPSWGQTLWRRTAAALLEKMADVVAVAASEVPARLNFRLKVAGTLRRSDPRSVLITRPGERFATLRLESKVAAVGALRKAQLLRIRPDLLIERADEDPSAAANAVDDGLLDGVVMPSDACPAREREPAPLPVAWFLPTPGQGVIALIIREGDVAAEGFVARISHEPSLRELAAERSFASSLGESTGPAFGALAAVSGAAVKLAGAVFSEDGSRETSAEVAGPASEAEHLGRYLAEILMARNVAPTMPPAIPSPEAGWPFPSVYTTQSMASPRTV